MPEQPELPLEYPIHDHYTVELRRGPLHGEQPVRTHEARSRDDALNLIDGLLDTSRERDGVVWNAEEVDAQGRIFGMRDGEVYLIVVTPPLSEDLS